MAANEIGYKILTVLKKTLSGYKPSFFFSKTAGTSNQNLAMMRSGWRPKLQILVWLSLVKFSESIVESWFYFGMMVLPEDNGQGHGSNDGRHADQATFCSASSITTAGTTGTIRSEGHAEFGLALAPGRTVDVARSVLDRRDAAH